MRPVFWAVCTVLTILPACQWQEDCQDEQGITRVHADPSFSDSEQDGIQQATFRWNLLAKRVAVLAQARSYASHCTIINSSKEDVGDGKGWEGVERGATGNIEIARILNCNGEPRSRDLPCFEAVVMHELGHLLGLGHHADGVDGIMRGTGGAALDFTDNDRRACEAIGVCR